MMSIWITYIYKAYLRWVCRKTASVFGVELVAVSTGCVRISRRQTVCSCAMLALARKRDYVAEDKSAESRISRSVLLG